MQTLQKNTSRRKADFHGVRRLARQRLVGRWRPGLRSARSELSTEFVEAVLEAAMRGMQVFALSDEANTGPGADALPSQEILETVEIVGVDDQEFVLVELHLNRTFGVHDRYTCAAVVNEEFLEVPQRAFENHSFDPFAQIIVVVAIISLMA